MVDLVAVVHRPVWLEVHHHRLGPDREAAGEDVEVLDRGLQVHQPLAGGVVDGVQLRRVADARDADPLAAVEGLHVERVADLRRDLLEVEGKVVALGGRLEALVRGRALVRDQPRLRHVQAEPHHRAVGRVLLHRLERERVVQQVDVVHQRDLLQPLARDRVPPAEAVDHERVTRLRAEVERLVRDSLGGQLVRHAAVLDRADLGEQVLEGARPVLFGAEQQADQMRACAVIGSGGDDARSGHATRASRAASRGPRGRARCGSPSRRAARRSVWCFRAPRSCPPTAPAPRSGAG